jgi:hypothetical protein
VTPVWFWPAVIAVAVAAALLLAVWGHLSLRAPAAAVGLYRRHFADLGRERLFLASLSFFTTFVLVRALTQAIRVGTGPFRDLTTRGLHVHHLVWGILLLLAVGLCWLARIGVDAARGSRTAARLTALLYGVGAALTLDEFALWLRLEDVYWSPQGRESVEAVLLFGGVLAVMAGGGRFFRALVRRSLRLLIRGE